MQRFSSHLNGFAACEEVCNAAIPPPSMYRRRPPVVCPKPRRVSCWTASDVAVDLRSLPCTERQTGCAELADSAIGDELLEIFLKKDSYVVEQEEEEEHQASWSLISSSPPYFCGSPPRRASNPLVHDPNFLQGKLNDTSLTQSPFEEYTHYTTTTTVATHKYQPPSGQPAASGCFAVATATPAGSARRASCLRSSDNFGPNPAMVRVEGFDCFNRRGGRGCSISAFA